MNVHCRFLDRSKQAAATLSPAGRWQTKEFDRKASRVFGSIKIAAKKFSAKKLACVPVL
jgi:hypothetical protein